VFRSVSIVNVECIQSFSFFSKTPNIEDLKYLCYSAEAKPEFCQRFVRVACF
jgi:hypothetical protein